MTTGFGFVLFALRIDMLFFRIIKIVYKNYKPQVMTNAIFSMIIAKQHKYIRALKKFEATSAAKSVDLKEYGIRKSLAFNKLVREGVIIETFNKRYYLDATKEEEQRRRRQTIIIMLLIFIISAMVISIIVIDYFAGDKILMIEQW